MCIQKTLMEGLSHESTTLLGDGWSNLEGREKGVHRLEFKELQGAIGCSQANINGSQSY